MVGLQIIDWSTLHVHEGHWVQNNERTSYTYISQSNQKETMSNNKVLKICGGNSFSRIHEILQNELCRERIGCRRPTQTSRCPLLIMHEHVLIFSSPSPLHRHNSSALAFVLIFHPICFLLLHTLVFLLMTVQFYLCCDWFHRIRAYVVSSKWVDVPYISLPRVFHSFQSN